MVSAAIAAGATGASAAPPAAPSGVQVSFDHWSNGQDTITVSWTASPDTVSGYHVQAQSGDTPFSAPTTSFSHADVAGDQTTATFDVSAGTNPEISVGVFGLGADGVTYGQGAYATLSGVPVAPTLSVTAVSGVVGQATAVVGAAAPGDTLVLRDKANGTPQSPSDGTAVPLGSDAQTTVTGLIPGTRYGFSLFEVGTLDPTDWSSPTQVNGQSAPPAPQSISAQLGMQDATEVGLSWSYPASCAIQTPPCRRATIVLKQGSVPPADPTDGTDALNGATTDATSYFLTSLTPNATYSVSVFNTAGSVYSAPATTTFTDVVYSDLEVAVSPVSPLPAGRSLHFTATLTGPLQVPTGTITVRTGNTTLCANIVAAAGSATCNTTTTKLGVGKHIISVTYSGDDTYQPNDVGAVFQVTALPTKVVLHKHASQIKRGKSLSLSGVLEQSTHVLAKQKVVLFSRPAGTSLWAKTSAMTTSRTGALHFSLAPKRTTQYQVRFLGTGIYRACATSAFTIKVLS